MNYLIIGFGIVGSNLADQLEGNITVLEKQDFSIHHRSVQKVIRVKLDNDNFEVLLTENTEPGDIIIDTAVETDTADLVRWAFEHDRHYINTVCDMWLHKTLALTQNYKNIDNLLFEYTKEPLRLVSELTNGKTCLMGHGANIGMVNHFFKMAILEKTKADNRPLSDVMKSIRNVYILEKDTLSFKPSFQKQPSTFYNTWNILEFLLESAALPDYPSNGQVAKKESPKVKDVFLDDMCLHGRLVSHEETFTIQHFLSEQGNATAEIQFLYECSPVGEVSRITFPWGSQYQSRTATHELNSEAGFDMVGCLLVFEDDTNWLYGYKMTQGSVPDHEATNATAWFVSLGVLAGVDLIRHYPNLGVNFPENLDFSLNEQAVKSFLQRSGRNHIISKKINGLFISDEYDTYSVHNLYAENKQSNHSSTY